jgi:hypothetical protein
LPVRFVRTGFLFRARDWRGAAETGSFDSRESKGRARSMWREQLDVFWDGERRLLLGFQDVDEAGAPKRPRPDLTIISAADAGFSGQTAFVDHLDASRWRASPCVVDAPPGHLHLALLAADGAELRLALEKNRSGVGDWRLALTLLPESGGGQPAILRVLSFSQRGDFERFAREQIALAGNRLAWACAQKRALTRTDGEAWTLNLWPARQVFPLARARLAIEPLPLSFEEYEDRREAPFAIMDQWLRESGAPRPILRLRLPDSLDESAHLLSRVCVVLVMQQRRRLRDWAREQKDAGEPVVDPLGVEDIRQAVGEPHEQPDAVWSNDSIVVANLLRLLTAPDETPFDGFALRRQAPGSAPSAPGAGAALDLDFFGAALGDDIGLVSGVAEAGDLSAAPRDPGGAAAIRLFRVEGDGVAPRKLGEDDPLLEEILRRAADQDAAPTGQMVRAVAERAASLQARRERLAQSLNSALARADYPGRLDGAGAWEALDPVLLAAFTALIREASAAGRSFAARLGGYRAFRFDPSLFAALARRPDWAEGAVGPSNAAIDAPLVYRFARACGVEGLIAPELSVAEQARVFDFLMETPEPKTLRRVRLQLGGGDGPDSAALARALSDASALEDAAAFFESQGDATSAAMLGQYLDDRAAGVWTPLARAAPLARILSAAKEGRERAENTPTEEAPPPPPAPKGLLAAVKGFFGGR